MTRWLISGSIFVHLQTLKICPVKFKCIKFGSIFGQLLKNHKNLPVTLKLLQKLRNFTTSGHTDNESPLLTIRPDILPFHVYLIDK